MADEDARLERELAELRQQVQQAKSHAEELRRLRQEEERRCEAAESRVEELRSLRQEEERQYEEEQRQYEEEQRQYEENKRRREAAEQVIKPQTLNSYLKACHALSLSVQVVTDRALTTQDETTNPAGRIYPKRIIPWDDFPTRQEEVWEQLEDPAFLSEPQFPSQHQVDYIQSVNRPLSSEIRVRLFEYNTVEDAVQRIIQATYDNQQLRDRLRLRGSVSFDSDSILEVSIARGICICRTSDGHRIPVTAIEYKAPHMLSQEEIVTGLVSEIEPKRDVINKDGTSFSFAAKTLAAAVVTQLFSYMVGKGIQYGYICNGETFVFLHIADDPSTVYYHVCVPNVDVCDDDENRLHRTAVAQVLAFTMQALRSTPRPSSWYDEAARLDRWAFEYEDLLAKIPASIRKERQRYASPYKPQRWEGVKRSPIQTRSRWKLSAGKEAQQSIHERPYCTHQCLLGLANGGPIDTACPNACHHGSKHLPITKFPALISAQIARDRGPDADSTPLNLLGSIGALFKVCLSAYGYTVVAKGVEEEDLARLEHEVDIYTHLRSIQGQYIPVCLGKVDLDLPLYQQGRICRHLMLLSWAGRPLPYCVEEIEDTGPIPGMIARAFAAIHQLHVLHGDAKARNITCTERAMVVDFERARVERLPLGSIGTNSPKRNRGGEKPETRLDAFTEEQQTILQSVAQCLECLGRE